MRYVTTLAARYVLLVLLNILFVGAMASTDPTIKKTLAASSIHKDSVLELSDKYYDASYNGKIDTPFTVFNVITLRINEDTLFKLPARFNASVNLRIYLTRPDNTVDSLDKVLAIHYNIDSIYSNRSYFVDTGAHKVKLKVLAVSIDTSGVEFDSSKILPALQLDNELTSNTNYIFSCTGTAQRITSIVLPSGFSLDSTSDELKANWASRTGADEYDFEWTYVDSSVLNRYKSGTNYIAASIFDNNATRISTTKNTYSIPLMYGNGGVVFMRMRAVQVKSDGSRINGQWSTDFSGGLGVCSFTGHQGNVNWQSSVTYAEGGKRKVVIQYYDGSLRSRQTVTKDNTTNTVIAAETMYDYQGRPVIQVMPAPSLNTLIKYTNRLNNYQTDSAEYDKSRYDVSAADSDYCCTAAPPMDSTTSGAAYYYSVNYFNNATTNAAFKFMDAAYGYAFTETRYTQDNTGRISSQSGVGKMFKLGSGHETKYYYGSPDQTELDALFGTEVGDKNHYFKNMVRDANGQLSVSYVDMHGRTIATALAGSLPDSIKLDTLVSSRKISLSESLTDSATVVIKGPDIESHKSLLVSTPGDYTFRYDLGPQSLKEKTCGTDSICYSCLYNLEVTITDDCNNRTLPNHKAYDTVISNFSIVSFNANGCSTDTGFHFSKTLQLATGNYEIIKKLTISSYGRQQYRDSVFAKHNVCTTVDQLIQYQLDHQNKGNCAGSCQACTDSLGTWSSFKSRYILQTGVNSTDTATAWVAYQSALADCKALCDTVNGDDEDIRQAMLLDVSAPSGQYARIANLDTYSIFTVSGGTSKYKSTSLTYYDDYGNVDSVYNDSTGLYVSPKGLDTAQFARKFKSSWANTLLPFHPEYCKLITYETYKSSLHWDKLFQKVDSYASALSKGYLNPTANSTGSPYSTYTAITANKDSLAQYSTMLKDSLEYYLKYYKKVRIGTAAYDVSLWTLAAMMTKCHNDNACAEDMITNHRGFEVLPCDGDKDIAWQHFRDLYLQIKAGMLNYQVNSANCTGYTNYSVATLTASGHTPHFYNAQDGLTKGGLGFYATNTDTTALKDSANKALRDYYTSNCNAYVTLWALQLAPCKYDSLALHDTIIPRLKKVCIEGADIDHPYGSREIAPGSGYMFANFDTVLNQYNRTHGISNKLACNADLLLQPARHNSQPVYSAKPVVSKPADSECSRINELYTEYTVNAISADTSFAAYLARKYHTVMTDADLTKLRSLCADTGSCKYISTPISLPPALQSNSGDICVTCNAVKSLYDQFVALYDTVPVAVRPGDTTNYDGVNTLFGNFMNLRLGFNKQAWEYLVFLNRCNNAASPPLTQTNVLKSMGVGGIMMDSQAQLAYPLMDCVGCDSLQHLVNNYFDTVSYGAATEDGMLVAIKNSLYGKGFFTTTVEIRQALANCHSSWQDNMSINTTAFAAFSSPQLELHSENFSIESWFYMARQDTINKIIAQCGDQTFGNLSGYFLALKNNHVSFLLADGYYNSLNGLSVAHNAGGRAQIRTIDTVSLFKWHHVTAERIGNNASGFKIYIDGKLQSTEIVDSNYYLSGGDIYSEYSGAAIVVSAGMLGYDWGRVKNTRLYRRVMDSAEIVANFRSCDGQPVDTTAMLLWAKFNEGQGVIPHDFSRYNSTGWFRSDALIWAGGFGPAVCDNCLIHSSSVLCNYPQADTLLLCGGNEPVLPPDTSAQVTCCSDSLVFAQSIGKEWYRVYTDSVNNRFDSDYNARCLRAASYETFTVTHQQSEYHYTLYYYDQAGNLLKTVAPAGVKGNWRQGWYDSVAAARKAGATLVPAHTLVTQYRYNSLNQVMAQQTPDAGKSAYWYDRLGRLTLSQNSKQQPQNKYSYTDYDYLGRIDEVGEISSSTAMDDTISRRQTNLEAWMTAAASSKTQITQTTYDSAYNPLEPVMAAKNLRTRVAWTAVYDTKANMDTLGFASATFYSYDIHGNVDTLLLDFKHGVMRDNNNRFKKVVYQYDLISGKVNWVGYQPGKADAFYHRYSYDAENRITSVETSKDSVVWEKDAAYTYYRHGPLLRTVLGQQQVQGLDYAYTLQGWLKGVNSSWGNAPIPDPQHDGGPGFGNVHVARDAMGFVLYYYKNDYRSLVNIGNGFNSYGDASRSANFKGLYNGNIAAMNVVIPKLNDTSILYTYTYDQLNRLTAMQANGVNNSTNWTPVTYKAYQEKVSYDANGNILTYNRYGNGTTTASIMDSLKYGYYPNTNRLDSVGDKVADNAFASDIDNQQAHNYTYDPIGNMTKDNKNGVDSIYWNVYGKITKVVKQDTTITYTYDPAGNRISKTINKAGNITSEWYVRDASGNVMSIYSKGDNSINSGALTQAEVPMYGSSRLGIYKPNVNVQSIAPPDSTILPGLGNGYTYTYLRGRKFFELSNHLGNVLVTITDKKIGVDDGVYSGSTRTSITSDGKLDYYQADVVSAQDYYPGGAIEPGRSFSAGSQYRYGFNGQEKDNEIGDGLYTAEYWEYDSRILRRWNLDPKPDISVSPYAVLVDNPIGNSDPKGDLPIAGGATGLSPFMEMVTEEYLKREVTMTVVRTVENPGFWARAVPYLGRAGGTIVLSFMPLYQAGNMNGLRLGPLVNPHPFPNLDPLRKPEDDEDGNKQTYIYQTGRSAKSYKPNDFTPSTTLPYFGITDNAFIAGIAVGRYSKQAEEAKNLPLFGGIIGKTDRITALGVEYALIALNTYGKGFDKKILSGKINPSSVDVYKSRRIDNLMFTVKGNDYLTRGVRWLQKHYGKNWQDKFYNPDNPAQNTNSGPSSGASDNTNHVIPVRNPGG